MSGGDALGLLELACDEPGRLGDDLADFAGGLGEQIGEFLVRKRAEELLLHQALHDPLTGLPNRVLFFDRLDHAIRRLQREHAPLAVLFLDFDGFKSVNDRFGHAGGDEVLKRAADRVSAALRAEDTVARFGGDELVVLSEHVAGAAGGALIAERILEQLRAPIEIDGERGDAVGQHRDLRGADRGRAPRRAAAHRGRGDVPGQGGGPGALRHRGGVTASPSRPFAPFSPPPRSSQNSTAPISASAAALAGPSQPGSVSPTSHRWLRRCNPYWSVANTSSGVCQDIFATATSITMPSAR